jgi:thiamine monophosphate synthase
MGKPLGLSELRSAAVQVSIPIFAIGGIRFDRIPELIRSGARGVAAISVLLQVSDPQESAERLLRELKTERSAATLP